MHDAARQTPALEHAHGAAVEADTVGPEGLRGAGIWVQSERENECTPRENTPHQEFAINCKTPQRSIPLVTSPTRNLT